MPLRVRHIRSGIFKRSDAKHFAKCGDKTLYFCINYCHERKEKTCLKLKKWCKSVAEEMVKDKPGKVALKCVDCGEIFIIDRERPLHDQVSELHTWGKGDFTLRHKTQEDRLDEQAEKEICHECGVPHGPNPYTGC